MLQIFGYRKIAYQEPNQILLKKGSFLGSYNQKKYKDGVSRMTKSRESKVLAHFLSLFSPVALSLSPSLLPSHLCCIPMMN